MNDILKRIGQLIENEDISIRSFEQKINATQGVIAKVLRAGTDIQSKNIAAIVDNFPQYSPEWLLAGNGEMLKKNQNVPEKTHPFVEEHNLSYKVSNNSANDKKNVDVNVIGNSIKDSVNISGNNNQYNPNDIDYIKMVIDSKDKRIAEKEIMVKNMIEREKKLMEQNAILVQQVSKLSDIIATTHQK